ncbi:uncharacterized protein LOC119076990 isoform X1 [Bradysia coprophila]|uniref:uncharacterized protein LOC119076990 isoform X1 n=1 Tax=Bradysia coprophila TaxID=38358 RepID=UPI00187DD1CB|nr:uncharacterized protein LOC119076990 isoform X1 [Bradysia coprophila]
MRIFLIVLLYVATVRAVPIGGLLGSLTSSVPIIGSTGGSSGGGLLGGLTNNLPIVGTGGGGSGGLLAEVTQALPIGGDSGLLGNLVGDVTNIIGDLTKILPVGDLLGGSSVAGGTGGGPLGNLLTAPFAVGMLFITALLPSILPFLIPVIERLVPIATQILTPLVPQVVSIITQCGPALFPIIKPFLPYLVPLYLRLLPHFIAIAPDMVPSLLQALLGVQNLLPAALPAP